MTVISAPLIVFLSSLFLVHKFTEYILIPEQWLLGLRVCLPAAMNDSKKNDFYMRLEPVCIVCICSSCTLTPSLSLRYKRKCYPTFITSKNLIE
jgi:hypothetical protein